ncbi:MAG: D-isomer specific 2-hydroxyacid dehydrogenase family protein [Microgenomates group bacterium]
MKKALFTNCSFSDEDIKILKENGVEVKKADADLSEDKLIEELQDCNYYIIGGTDKATKKVIESTKLDLIIFYGTGYENYVDVETANKLNIPVANTPKANAYTVAEHAVAMVLDAVKQITYLNNTTKDGQWLRRQTWNLENKTIGIVGMGTIGSTIARIMQNAFKMKVLYVSREKKEEVEKELGAEKVDLETLFSKSDVVSINASYNDQTVNMIGEAQLSKMQPHAVLACTSRAELIDPKALKEALDTNKLAVAAFDVYYQEPAPKKEDDKWGLLSLPDNKFVITPHTAYGSKEAMQNMNDMTIENIISYQKDSKAKYQVNLK